MWTLTMKCNRNGMLSSNSWDNTKEQWQRTQNPQNNKQDNNGIGTSIYMCREISESGGRISTRERQEKDSYKTECFSGVASSVRPGLCIYKTSRLKYKAGWLQEEDDEILDVIYLMEYLAPPVRLGSRGYPPQEIRGKVDLLGLLQNWARF